MKNIIKFVGNNEKLFSRVIVESLQPKQTLIVPETHNAILIKDGQMLQTLSSGKYFIDDFVDLKTEGDTALEVLFMSKTAKLKMRWGTPQRLFMFDTTLQENYRLGLSGDFEVQVGDPRKCYLYLVGASNDLTADALQERLQSNVVSVMEGVVVDFVRDNSVPFNQVVLYKKQISQKVQSVLGHKLQSEYGIAVFSFILSIDEADFNRLSNTIKNVDALVCRNCGATLKEGDKFCFRCGKKVTAPNVCPVCKTENADEAAFCANCGEKLS